MKKRIMFLGIAAVVALGCGAAGVGQSPVPAEAPSPFPGHIDRVTVLPAAVGAGQQVQLAAAVAAVGTIDRSVTWALAAGSLGSLDAATGLYSAPATAGTFTVVATSVADATKKGNGSVAVTAGPPPPPPGVVPAFPGAEGGGALSVGGRGGRVIEVTNLNDSGAGSLRACVDATGPRTCVFRVSGTIELLSGLTITNPYLTIAGQTSPGGIQLSGRRTNQANIYVWNAHDVVIRYIRSRHGNTGTVGAQAGDPIKVFRDSWNIIIDHCSFYWTEDQSLSFRGEAGLAPHDSTASWNILAEPLAPHDVTTLISASTPAEAARMVNLDWHHNFSSNTSHRNPAFSGASGRIVNNVIFNYGHVATELFGAARLDIVANIDKQGPRWAGTDKHEVRISPPSEVSTACPAGGPVRCASVYLSGNLAPHHLDPAATGTEWADMVRIITGENGSEIGPAGPELRRATPLPPAGIPITIEPVGTLEAALGLLGSTSPHPVGASQRLDCEGRWVANVDAADQRNIDQYRLQAGYDCGLKGTCNPAAGAKAVTHENDVGGFPVMPSFPPCADADHDGMPDAWERARGLDPADPSDGPRVTADGYTNLEHFLNGQ